MKLCYFSALLRREWSSALWNAGLAAVLLFVALELGLRVFNPIDLQYHLDRRTAAPNTRAVLINIPGLPVESGVQSTNAIGFRGPLPPPAFQSYLSLIAIGASTTLTPAVPDGSDWPLLSGRMLSTHFAKVWMNNAGASGHSSRSDLIVLRNVISELHPKVGLFLVGANDILLRKQIRIMDPGADPGHGALTWRETVRSAISHSVLLSTLTILVTSNRIQTRVDGATFREDVLRPRLPATTPSTSPQTIVADVAAYAHQRDDYRVRLRDLVHTAQRGGVLPVLLTQPVLGGHGRSVDGKVLLDRMWVSFYDIRIDSASAWALMESYNDITRQTAAEAGVPLIDLAHLLPKDSRYFYDTMHPTVLGSAATARIVVQALCPVLAARFPSHLMRPCGSHAAPAP